MDAKRNSLLARASLASVEPLPEQYLTTDPGIQYLGPHANGNKAREYDDMVNLGRVIVEKERTINVDRKPGLVPPHLNLGGATSQMSAVLDASQAGTAARVKLALFKSRNTM